MIARYAESVLEEKPIDTTECNWMRLEGAKLCRQPPSLCENGSFGIGYGILSRGVAAIAP